MSAIRGSDLFIGCIAGQVDVDPSWVIAASKNSCKIFAYQDDSGALNGSPLGPTERAERYACDEAGPRRVQPQSFALFAPCQLRCQARAAADAGPCPQPGVADRLPNVGYRQLPVDVLRGMCILPCTKCIPLADDTSEYETSISHAFQLCLLNGCAEVR